MFQADFHSFHRPPKKEKRSKKERNGCYYYLSNSPLTPEGEYYKGYPNRSGRKQAVVKAGNVLAEEHCTPHDNISKTTHEMFLQGSVIET